MRSPDPNPEQLPTDPDPSNTAGLEPGGGVAPGDTPPIASSMSGTSYHETPEGKIQSRTWFFLLLALVVLIALGWIVGAIFVLG
jgi:hypothetical protein